MIISKSDNDKQEQDHNENDHNKNKEDEMKHDVQEKDNDNPLSAPQDPNSMKSPFDDSDYSLCKDSLTTGFTSQRFERIH